MDMCELFFSPTTFVHLHLPKHMVKIKVIGDPWGKGAIITQVDINRVGCIRVKITMK